MNYYFYINKWHVCFAVSLRVVRPVVSKLWLSAKTAAQKTAIKPLVCNFVVEKTEYALDKLTDKLILVMTALRDRQLPKEKIYLEKELEKIKERISKTKS